MNTYIWLTENNAFILPFFRILTFQFYFPTPLFSGSRRTIFSSIKWFFLPKIHFREGMLIFVPSYILLCSIQNKDLRWFGWFWHAVYQVKHTNIARKLEFSLKSHIWPNNEQETHQIAFFPFNSVHNSVYYHFEAVSSVNKHQRATIVSNQRL